MNTISNLIKEIVQAHNHVQEEYGKLKAAEDPSTILGASMDLMVAQQKASIMTESFNKQAKLTTDGVKNAIQSMG
jgi:hypothetical protein